MRLSNAALLVIDVQMGFAERDAQGARRSTPEAESNITSMLRMMRSSGGKVIHIHHHSKEPDSPFSPDVPGVKVQPFAAPLETETTYTKHANSAFIGTTLEADLRAAGIDTVILCGATANHCVETTARMGGNLGFNVLYVADAVWAYEGIGPDGRTHAPDDVLSMTLCNLDGEFASVSYARAVIEDLTSTTV